MESVCKGGVNEMSEAILGSIIVAILGMIGNIIVASKSADKMQAVTDTNLENYKEMTNKEISDLRKTVEKHNNLVERVAVLERDNKTAFNRIDELRADIREIKKEI